MSDQMNDDMQNVVPEPVKEEEGAERLVNEQEQPMNEQKRPMSEQEQRIYQQKLARQAEMAAIKQENDRQEACVKVIGDQFGYYGLLSFAFGVLYSLCLYKNTSGILVPVFTAVSYGIAYLVLKKMNVEVKRWSYYLAGISLLISISTCRTANYFFLFFNKQAVLLLWWVFWLHQFYHDDSWNIGKYFCSIIQFIFRAVCALGYPFQHCAAYVKSLKSQKSRNLVMVLLGVAVAIPLVSLLTVLLSEADMVFQDILTTFLDTFLKPGTVIGVICKTLFGMIVCYCIICEVSRKGISETSEDRRKQEPIVAITAMGLVGLLYVMFCGIQIVYLFMGKGVLPDNMTYSEYARQGFFQLVFVSVLNLVLVLLCLKYFRKSRILNGVLTVISLCTYVMMASAAYRMILYISEYHLTLLRILVLWFLVVLAILMAGVLLIIYRNTFPLFRYCLVVISMAYMVLSWSKPDFIIAKYNCRYVDEWGYQDIYYITHLSADAAPEVAKLKGISIDEHDYVNRFFGSNDKKMSWRTYNFTYAKAKKYQ